MFSHLRPVVTILDGLNVPWLLGGSLASMLVGEMRLTTDIDLALRISAIDVPRLVKAFDDDYYIDADMIRDAIARTSSFNILHYGSGTKINMFVNGTTVLDHNQFERRIRKLVDQDDLGEPFHVWIPTPEDQILRKLWWYRLGGEVSERQLRDVAGMIAVSAGDLDVAYLTATAGEAGVTDLVEQALAG